MTEGRLHRPFYRNGDEHRGGADVTFQDIVKVFGFRTVNIGRWVTPDEQQIAANLFFDALCDLQDILNVPEQVISLNGNLSLAFGVGGNKHSSAHYSPHKKQLALAKNAGGGALAHEWFHAFDHYICPRMYEAVSSTDFASAVWLASHELIPHPLNHMLNDCFHSIFLSDDGQQPSDLVRNSAQTDKALKMFYYAQPQEMAARAFEAFVQDVPIKNAFLVQGTKQSQEVKLGVYPTGPHKEVVKQQFINYFHRLGATLSKGRMRK